MEHITPLIRRLRRRLTTRHYITGGAASILVVLFVALLILNDDSTRAHDQATATPVPATSTIAPTPPPPTPTTNPCPSTASDRQAIDRLLAAGQYGTAYQVALTALADKELCQPDRQQLAASAVEAGLSAITAEPADPANLLVQNQLLDRYATVIQLAKDYHVPLPRTLRQISGTLFSTQAYVAAIKAFLDALNAGDLGSVDLLPLSEQRYLISAYYNAGRHLTGTDASPQWRDQGGRYLATSCQIDRVRHGGDFLACERLRLLWGTDERLWPQPFETPLATH